MTEASLPAVHDIALLLLSVAAAAASGVLGAMLARISEPAAGGRALIAVVLGAGVWIATLLGLHAYGFSIAIGWSGVPAWLALPAVVATAFTALWMMDRPGAGYAALIRACLVLGGGIVVAQQLTIRATGADVPPIGSLSALLLTSLIAVGGSAAWLKLWVPRTGVVSWPGALARYGGIVLAMVIATAGAQLAGMALSGFPVGSRAAGQVQASGWLLPALTGIALLLLFATASVVAQSLLRWVRRIRQQHNSMQESHTRIRALYDPATMMRNRASLQLELANLIYRCEAAGRRFDVLQGTLHLPGLHEDGEIGRAMAVIAARMRPLLRASDLLARSGPTAFVLLRPREHDGDLPNVLLERLLTACQLPLSVDRLTISPHARLGCSCFPDDGLNSRQLLLAAMPDEGRVIREAPAAADVGADGQVAA